MSKDAENLIESVSIELIKLFFQIVTQILVLEVSRDTQKEIIKAFHDQFIIFYKAFLRVPVYSWEQGSALNQSYDALVQFLKGCLLVNDKDMQQYGLVNQSIITQCNDTKEALVSLRLNCPTVEQQQYYLQFQYSLIMIIRPTALNYYVKRLEAYQTEKDDILEKIKQLESEQSTESQSSLPVTPRVTPRKAGSCLITKTNSTQAKAESAQAEENFLNQMVEAAKTVNNSLPLPFSYETKTIDKIAAFALAIRNLCKTSLKNREQSKPGFIISFIARRCSFLPTKITSYCQDRVATYEELQKQYQAVDKAWQQAPSEFQKLADYANRPEKEIYQHFCPSPPSSPQKKTAAGGEEISAGTTSFAAVSARLTSKTEEEKAARHKQVNKQVNKIDRRIKAITGANEWLKVAPALGKTPPRSPSRDENFLLSPPSSPELSPPGTPRSCSPPLFLGKQEPATEQLQPRTLQF